MTPPKGIPSEVLDEAADWLMRLQSGEADAAAFERWRGRSPEHARAWERAQALLGKLDAVPPALAMPTLARPARRNALAKLGKLALLLGCLPAAWLAHREYQQHGFGADFRTATGEQREVVLADGTRITLNTATAFDVQFDEAVRSILLRSGEILVHSAPDNAGARPLQIVTRHGIATPLGTRFTVRQDDDSSHVAVQQGRVRITAASGRASQTLEAGQQTRYTRDGIAPLEAAGDSAAWARGMLLADDMPLDALAAELSRYRNGLIQCEDSIATLRISGAFPVGSAEATDRSLAMLADTHPLRIRRRLGGLWVTLEARD